LSQSKPKVLFFSPTTYNTPLDESIKKKFEILSSIANVKVFAYKNNKRNNKESSQFYLFRKPKNRFYRFIKSVFISLFLMRKHFSKADIVVFQEPILSTFSLLSISTLKNPPKVVVESHGDFINTIVLEKNLIFPSAYKYIFKKMASYTLTKADCIRVISSSTRSQVSLFVQSKPIVEFPAWIDLNLFLETTYNPSPDNILFLGSVTERKNPLLILRSLNYLREKIDFKVDIIGPQTNKEYLRLINNYIDHNKLSSKVRIKGQVPINEVARYLSEATLLILPSVSEGLGRVILEAQAVGCPVLVSDAGGMKDLIDDGETGFIFNNNNLEDFSEKISYILSNNDLRKKVSSNGRRKVVNYHESQSFINGYKDIFQKVAK
tara:strand:- start:141 stop:1274 length:1134 start_codon:yes stop_codon:yes gene_type:complete